MSSFCLTLLRPSWYLALFRSSFGRKITWRYNSSLGRHLNIYVMHCSQAVAMLLVIWQWPNCVLARWDLIMNMWSSDIWTFFIRTQDRSKPMCRLLIKILPSQTANTSLEFSKRVFVWIAPKVLDFTHWDSFESFLDIKRLKVCFQNGTNCLANLSIHQCSKDPIISNPLSVDPRNKTSFGLILVLWRTSYSLSRFQRDVLKFILIARSFPSQTEYGAPTEVFKREVSSSGLT